MGVLILGKAILVDLSMNKEGLHCLVIKYENDPVYFQTYRSKEFLLSQPAFSFVTALQHLNMLFYCLHLSLVGMWLSWDIFQLSNVCVR